MAAKTASPPPEPAPAAVDVLELGRTVMTRGVAVLAEAGQFNPAYVIARHQRHDWGDVGEGNAKRNEVALRDGERIFSVYNLPCGVIWCITDAVGDDGHRAVTTLLLPHEY